MKQKRVLAAATREKALVHTRRHAAIYALLALVAGAVVLVGLAAPARATYPGSNDGRLAFGVDLEPTGVLPQIYSILPNGEDFRQLTDSVGQNICPAYSADGKEIAFCSNRTGSFEIWKMKPNGTQQMRVTHLAEFATFPDFSPDGRTIVFASPAPGSPVQSPPDIWAIDSDGHGAPVRLTDNPAMDGLPAYSPDGSKIAFVRPEAAFRRFG